MLHNRSLRGSAAVAMLVGVPIVVSVAWAARDLLALSPLYVWKTIALFTAISLIVLGAIDQGHPFDRFGAANSTTLARAGLAALVAAIAGEPFTPMVAAAATGAGLIATALDGADGWMARRSRMTSPFGARFDMETDALLMLALAIAARSFGKAGSWILLSGLLRYVFVAAGRVWPWLESPLPPSTRRKIVCVVQLLALCAVVSPVFMPPYSDRLAAAALAFLSASFLVDVVWLWRFSVRPTTAGAPAFPSSS